MRLIQMPHILRLIHSQEEMYRLVEAGLEILGTSRPLIVHGKMVSARIGMEIVSQSRFDCKLGQVKEASFVDIQRLEREAFEFRPDAVLAIGGGTALDVGKHLAHRMHLPCIVIPTQVSHDGISSPIVVLRDQSGRKRSLGSTMPAAIIIPIHIITTAPMESIRAGIGDLLSNLSALVDWRIACDSGHDSYDDFAALIAQHASTTLMGLLEGGHNPSLQSEEFLEIMIEGLILSGLAMSVAGSSRPCSGAEHLISHAIDYLYGGRALHGLQVAAATPITLHLQGKDELADKLERIYRLIGLPRNLIDLGFTFDEICSLLARAPAMRPERYTILNGYTELQPSDWAELLNPFYPA